MAFRSDHDALLARNHALEQELEDAKQALLVTEQELEDAKNPPPLVEKASRREESTTRSPGPAPQGNPKALGAYLAEQLVSADQERAGEALRELRKGAPLVNDGAARVLAAHLRRGGPEAERAIRVLAQKDAPAFGGNSWNRLVAALAKRSEREDSGSSAKAAMESLVQRGYDQSYIRKKQEVLAASASTGLLRRVASVATRAWVIVVLGFPLLMGLLLIITTPEARVWTLSGLCVLAGLVVLIDARLRRCPSCRKLLAGKLLTIVADGYGGHIQSWSCVFCKHQWNN